MNAEPQRSPIEQKAAASHDVTDCEVQRGSHASQISSPKKRWIFEVTYAPTSL
jgi:hypothetical protein